MGLLCPELSLDLKAASYVPETINGFIKQVSIIADVSERVQKLDEFVTKLQEELNKIQLFQTDLPLSMLLLKDAILALKQETTQYKTRNAYQPVLEEFIPLKKQSSVENTQITKLDSDEKQAEEEEEEKEDCKRDKKNWMSSVQLWRNSDDFPTTSSTHPVPLNKHHSLSSMGDTKRSEISVDDGHHLCKDKGGSNGFVVPMLHTYPTFPQLRKVEKEDATLPGGLSLLSPGIIRDPKQQQLSIPTPLTSKLQVIKAPHSSPPTTTRPLHPQSTTRKQRRCWSAELHRKFVDALTQLGGAQVATPKQIRELMRVDSLTNDEVKSHLQKYRLHSRRLPNKSSASTTDNDLAASWPSQDQYCESSKPSSLQSGSPEGPLQFPEITGGTSTTAGDSMEDEDDEKSESYSWKGHVQRPGAVDV